MTTSADPTPLTRAAGIRAIAVPTPYTVGPVNAYLIDDDPLTLVDSGPSSALALEALEHGIRTAGRRVEDLGLIILTHPHLDHFGLAGILARRSGAEIAAVDAAVAYVEDFAGQTMADNRYVERTMVRHGVPRRLARVLRLLADRECAWSASARVTRRLTDGEALALRDRALSVALRPGHSPFDILLTDEAASISFTGDHLIKHIASNPLLTRPTAGAYDSDGPRPQALVALLDSLRATRAMEIGLMLPGHGEPITRCAELIDERLAGHEQRARAMLRIIEARPMTAYEIAQHLWGDAAIDEAYLTLSAVLGHVDLLLNRRQAVEDDDGDVVRFRAA